MFNKSAKVEGNATATDVYVTYKHCGSYHKENVFQAMVFDSRNPETPLFYLLPYAKYVTEETETQIRSTYETGIYVCLDNCTATNRMVIHDCHQLKSARSQFDEELVKGVCRYFDVEMSNTDIILFLERIRMGFVYVAEE